MANRTPTPRRTSDLSSITAADRRQAIGLARTHAADLAEIGDAVLTISKIGLAIGGALLLVSQLSQANQDDS